MSAALNPSPLQNFAWSPEPARWLNRFAQLSEQTQARWQAPLGVNWQGDPLPMPRWVAVNHGLAADMGWPAHWSLDG